MSRKRAEDLDESVVKETSLRIASSAELEGSGVVCPGEPSSAGNDHPGKVSLRALNSSPISAGAPTCRIFFRCCSSSLPLDAQAAAVATNSVMRSRRLRALWAPGDSPVPGGSDELIGWLKRLRRR